LSRILTAPRFHPRVVESLKSQFVRVFLTEVLQSDLSDTAKSVYRYFYRFSDQSAVSRKYALLMQAFPWNSGEKRFVIWLKKQLTELKAYGVVKEFILQDDGVIVQCTPYRQLKKAAVVVAVDTPPATFGAEVAQEEDILAKIPTLLKDGTISDSDTQVLASIISNSGRLAAADSLRRFLANKSKLTVQSKHSLAR